MTNIFAVYGELVKCVITGELIENIPLAASFSAIYNPQSRTTEEVLPAVHQGIGS